MHKHGQTLPEYCLAIALVAVVSLAGLTPLGKTLFDHFSNMGGQAKTINGSLSATSGSGPMPLGTNFSPGSGNAGGTTAGSLGAGNTTAPSSTASMAATGAYQGVTATLKNGAKLNLGQYPANPEEMVETAGVSGTTNYMLGVIETMSQQLLASGSITQDQYNSLVNLSNRGHDIGKVQGQLEALMQNNGGTLNGLRDQPMPILGKKSFDSGWFEYTVASNAQALGSGNTGPYGPNININWLTSFQPNADSWANPLYNSFTDAYNAAKSDGSLADPVVKQIVDDLAFKILISGEIFEEYNDKPIIQGVKSAFTHYNSKGICNQGNGKDSGIQCSPS